MGASVLDDHEPQQRNRKRQCDNEHQSPPRYLQEIGASARISAEICFHPASVRPRPPAARGRAMNSQQQPVQEPPLQDPLSVHEVLTKMLALLSEVYSMIQQMPAPAAPTPSPQAAKHTFPETRASNDGSVQQLCQQCGKPTTLMLGSGALADRYICPWCREPRKMRTRPPSY